MKITGISAVAAALLASSLFGARPAAAQQVLVRCDKPMTDADMMTRTVVECYDVIVASRAALAAAASNAVNAPAAASADVGIDTTTAPVPEDVSKPEALEQLRLATAEPIFTHLKDYYVYTAYASGDPAACSRLGVLKKDKDCRETVAALSIARAQFGTPAETVAACRKTGAPAQCCAQLGSLRGDPDPCAQMAGCFPDAATCRATWGRVKGDAISCRGLGSLQKPGCKEDQCRANHAEQIGICTGTAAYAKAAKSNDLAQCGDSDVCRVLMGAGKQVAKEIAAKHLRNPGGAWFLKSGWKSSVAARGPSGPKSNAPASFVPKKNLNFRGFVCAEPLLSIENRRAVTTALLAAHTCLTDVEAALSRPARDVAAGIDEREEKLARMSLKLDKFIGGAEKSPKPAKAAKKTL